MDGTYFCSLELHQNLRAKFHASKTSFSTKPFHRSISADNSGQVSVVDPLCVHVINCNCAALVCRCLCRVSFSFGAL